MPRSRLVGHRRRRGAGGPPRRACRIARQGDDVLAAPLAAGRREGGARQRRGAGRRGESQRGDGAGQEDAHGHDHSAPKRGGPTPRLSSGAVHTVVMTVSTSVSRREAEDRSGPLLAHLAEEAGAEIVAMEVVPDDLALIEDRLHHYVDQGVTFIFTTGGTGLTIDDITPEATWAVIAREAPGHRRGDARGEHAAHADGHAQPRRRGRGGPDADRQLPRAARRRSSSSSPCWRRCSSTPPPRWAAMVAAAPAIELAGLTRRYGERVALQDVTLTLPAGATLVVFGPNGAGKSTLLRVLATLLRPHAGIARVLGHALPDEGWAVRGRIGLLGHAPLLYRDLSGRENLAFHARLHGVALERRGGAHRAGRAVRARRRQGPHLLARHGPAPGGLPRGAARPRGAAARRAARQPRSRCGRAGRAAHRRRQRAHAHRHEPRPGRRAGRGRPRARACAPGAPTWWRRRASSTPRGSERCTGEAHRSAPCCARSCAWSCARRRPCRRWRCSASPRSWSSTSRCSAGRSTAISPPACCG